METRLFQQTHGFEPFFLLYQVSGNLQFRQDRPFFSPLSLGLAKWQSRHDWAGERDSHPAQNSVAKLQAFPSERALQQTSLFCLLAVAKSQEPG